MLIFLLNTDDKILNKILENQIQQHIETITLHDQVGVIPGGTKMVQYLQIKKLYDYLNRCCKTIWQNPIFIHYKNSHHT